MPLGNKNITGRQALVVPKPSTGQVQSLRIFIIVLAAFILLLVATITSAHATPLNISGTVAGPPPTTPAVITTPTNNLQTPDNEIEVNGTCQSGLLVKVFKNTIFAGSTICDNNNKFFVSISLLPGRNDLTALNYDLLDQPGPNSDPVTVYLLQNGAAPTIPPEGQTSSTETISSRTDDVSKIFYVTTDYGLRTMSVGQAFTFKATINGGVAPYAAVVKWGDGEESVKSVNDAGELFLTHEYQKPGRFTINLRVSDSKDQTTTLQLIVIVNGKESESATTNMVNLTSSLTTLQQIGLTVGVSVTVVGLGFLLSNFVKFGFIRKIK